LKANGDVLVFGANEHGQLGTGTAVPVDHKHPVQLGTPTCASKIVTGGNHTFVLQD
jgi:alpha-tubulin suppressor-like RCC1 family protein